MRRNNQKRRKRILSCLLAGVMTLSMCACHDSAENNNGQGNNGQGNSDSVLNTAAKENVYHYESIDIGMDLKNAGIYDLVCVNNRIYAVVENYDSSMINTVMPRAVDVVVGSSQMVLVDSPNVSIEEAIEENTEEGAIENTEENAQVSTEDSTEDSTEEDASSEPQEDISEEFPMDEPIEEPIEYYGPSYYLISANVDGSEPKSMKLELGEKIPLNQGYMSNLQLLKDGSVAGTYELYTEDMSDPMNPVFSQFYYFLRWDNEGNFLWSTDVTGEDGNYFYAQMVEMDEQNNLTVFGNDSEVLKLDAEGKITKRYKNDSLDMKNMNQIIVNGVGTSYITSYNDDWTKFFVSTYDLATGQIGGKVELPSNLINYNILPGKNTDFLLTNSFGIYTYNIGDAEPVKMMDFINSDIATYGMNHISLLDDNSFVACFYDSVVEKNVIAKFSYVNPKDIPDKKSIVLGCNYLDNNVKSRVIDFNKTNLNYRIAIKDYSSYNTMNDYSAAQTQMNNDIISGSMPDIMMIEGNQDISSWANKGILAEVSELIAADEELSKLEYLDNVWEAFMVNDKLYTVIPSFAVQTMIARKDMVGDRTNWTMSEFQEYMKTLGEDVLPFGSDMLRESMLHYMMLYCGGDFVDVNSGTCNFNSEEFISMLEYAKTFPVEYPQDYWDNYDWESSQNLYRDKKAVLLFTYIYNMNDLVHSIHGQLGSDAAFIGFPGMGGNSSIIQPASNMFVISAKSSNIDGAWEFVRYYLTEDYQSSDNLYSLPVLKSAFEEKAKLGTMKPFWINQETGEKEEYEYTYYANGEEIVLEPFTQAEVDEITEFIYSVKKRSYYTEEIINIVTEEAESFFSGQKSARDAAAIIQSRAQLYVDENR